MFTFTVKSARQTIIGVCLTGAMACLLSASPASAQMTEAQQTAAITSLQGAVASLQTTVKSLQTTVTSQQTTINSLNSSVAGLQTKVNSQATMIAALQQKTAPISLVTTARADGKASTELYFTGVNVHIVSGSGATNDFAFSADGSPVPGKSLFALGNLILGYNAGGNSSSGQGDVRTGSHNLILGDKNNYSSFGGIVAGVNDTLSNRYSAVIAAEAGIALGDQSVVIGGENNTAANQQSAVFGGQFNLGGARFGTVLGGQNNTASGLQDPGSAPATTVTGGLGNLAWGQNAVISGGRNVVTYAGFGWAAGSEGSQNSWFTNYRSP